MLNWQWFILGKTVQSILAFGLWLYKNWLQSHSQSQFGQIVQLKTQLDMFNELC